MSKEGEINYLKKIDKDHIHHAVKKPFSDADCGRYLMEMGTIRTLLPQPPKKLLDLGCGTGWTSIFFAQCGYNVTGQDISPDMIDYANQNKLISNLTNVDFIVSDYEKLSYMEEFDCAIFFDSLHHSIDEDAALSAVYRALKPGGICITLEPGKGHETADYSREAVKKFDVTEKDMDPKKIIQSGKKAGFSSFQIYPHIRQIRDIVYSRNTSGTDLTRKLTELTNNYEKNDGIVVLVKPTLYNHNQELDSKVIRDSILPRMKSGESYPVSIVLKNTGNCSWKKQNLIRLGGLGDSQGVAYKFGVTRIDLPDDTLIKPGDSIELNFHISPCEKGTYNLELQMVMEFHQWFGEIFSKSIDII
jgi:SAM-dependent methyltransferase